MLTSIAGNTNAGYTYNYAGDVLTETVNGSTYTYQYDLFRKLTGISVSPGENVASYSYDGDGKRISKAVGGVTTYYHYDREGKLLSESDVNGNPICDYIYLGKTLVGKMVQPVSASPGAYYYHTDPGGTPLAITGNQCNVVWRGFYEPFGNEYNISGTISNDMRFVGNEKDNETGLNYFSARYLDVTLGRFLAPDPVGPVDSNTGKISDTVLTEPQRLNGYAYAGNNPLSRIDPAGKQYVALVAPFAEYAAMFPPYGDIAAAAIMAGALAADLYNHPLPVVPDDPAISDPMQASKPKPGSKPKDCPTGTKPIDKYPGLDKDAIHDIKHGVGAGPEDWTGISPDGDVITGGPEGEAVNNGPFKDYLQ